MVVIGGGVAGLAAAHRLGELARERGLGLEVTLVEARDRLGGVVVTERAGGFLVEGGPDSLVADRPWALALVERLGLGPRLCGTDPRHRRTFLVRHGRLHPLPEGFVLLAPTRWGPWVRSPLLSWRGKARMALDLVLPRGPEAGDESLARFVRRRFGREALERLAGPLVAGVYAADPEGLSLEATFPRFRELERAHRSVILGLRRVASARERADAAGARWGLFVTLAGGLGELVDALAAGLGPERVRLGWPAGAVGRDGAGYRVHGPGGADLAADGVVVAVPAPAAAVLLRPLDGELAAALAAIRYASAVVVALGYPRAAIRHPLDGFGAIVPPGEGRVIRGVTFASVKYPGRAPEGFVLLRAYLGGPEAEAWLGTADEALAAVAHTELAALLGIEGAPVLVRVVRHPAAQPQYEVGHLARVGAIEAALARHPGLALAGAAYRGLGLAEAVRSGEAAAARVLEALGPP